MREGEREGEGGKERGGVGRGEREANGKGTRGGGYT